MGGRGRIQSWGTEEEPIFWIAIVNQKWKCQHLRREGVKGIKKSRQQIIVSQSSIESPLQLKCLKSPAHLMTSI